MHKLKRTVKNRTDEQRHLEGAASVCAYQYLPANNLLFIEFTILQMNICQETLLRPRAGMMCVNPPRKSTIIIVCCPSRMDMVG